MDHAIEAVRAFNRFFTRHVGAMDARFLGTDANLAEARLLFEIAAREPVLARTLGDALDLDRGHLSRLVARFEARGLVARDRAAADARARPIRLTPSGRDLFAAIDRRQRDAVARDLSRLGPPGSDDLVRALTTARLLLDPDGAAPLAIRPARAGEVAAVAARQAELYRASHGWGRPLEVLVAETATAFLRDFKPGREQCSIADLGGATAGAVFLTDEGGGDARLRLLHVEPFARRRGIGDALVRTCVDFATAVGHRRITLWTHTVLEPARRLYARHGFACVATALHHEFGVPVQGETWRLVLPRPERPPGAPVTPPGDAAAAPPA